jgi:hypothetical protein
MKKIILSVCFGLILMGPINAMESTGDGQGVSSSGEDPQEYAPVFSFQALENQIYDIDNYIRIMLQRDPDAQESYLRYLDMLLKQEDIYQLPAKLDDLWDELTQGQEENPTDGPGLMIPFEGDAGDAQSEHGSDDQESTYSQDEEHEGAPEVASERREGFADIQEHIQALRLEHKSPKLHRRAMAKQLGAAHRNFRKLSKAYSKRFGHKPKHPKS